MITTGAIVFLGGKAHDLGLAKETRLLVVIDDDRFKFRVL